MKVIARILIILLAASVVVGATWTLTHNNNQNAQFGPGNALVRPNNTSNDEAFVPGQRPEGFRGGGFDRNRGRGGGFLPFDWIRNIFLIAVIVAVVVFVEFLADRRRIKRLAKVHTEDTIST